MKVAILGAGIAGLACAIELERNGIVPVVYERDANPGWLWPSVSFWPNVFYNVYGDPRQYLLENFNIDLMPLGQIRKLTLRVPEQQAEIIGNLGYVMLRGPDEGALGRQLARKLTQTAIRFNSKADYGTLAEENDYVVIATGKESEARELGVWRDEGTVITVAANVVGSFDPQKVEIYFNTEYAGTGYARVIPFSSSSAVISLFIIKKPVSDPLRSFTDFIRKEKLDKYEYVLRYITPTFTTGSVTSFRVENILLAGRSAGLTERVLGCGGFEALTSGTLAGRAIADGLDYEGLVKPFQEHIESISSYRRIIDDFDNEAFDSLIGAINIPGVKQILYSTGLSFTDMVGKVLKWMQQSDKLLN